MSQRFINRLWEIISNPGNSSTITLSNTPKDASYRVVSSSLSTGDTILYLIRSADGSQTVWEIGEGRYNGGTSFIREAVVDNSSSSTSLINFPAGNYDLISIHPASYIENQVTISQLLGIINNTYFTY